MNMQNKKSQIAYGQRSIVQYPLKKSGGGRSRKEWKSIRKRENIKLLQELFVSKLEVDINSINNGDLDNITRWDFNQYDDHMHIIKVSELIQRVLNDQEYTDEEIQDELDY